MFWLGKRQLLLRVLGYRMPTASGVTWWLADEGLASAAELASRIAREPAVVASLHGVQVLKSKGSRTVLRLRSCENAGAAHIVKIFHLRRFSHRMKYDMIGYNRFGLSEAANLVVAAERGLSVPKLYGYGRIQGISLLTEVSLVLMQDLGSCTSMRALMDLSQACPRQCAAILERAIPIFVELHRAKCNNIDVNLGSILVGTEESQRPFLVDFEYAVFGSTESLRVTMAAAARFGQECRGRLGTELLDEWVEKLLDALEVRDRARRKESVECFNYYLDARLSRKMRRRLHWE